MATKNRELKELQRQLTDLRTAPPVQPRPPPTLRLTCPSCNKQIEVLEKFVGKYFGTKIECSLCGHVFRASYRAEDKLQENLQRSEKIKKLAEEAEQKLLEMRDAREQQLLDLAAHGALQPEEELAEEAPAPATGHQNANHSWPYDHHQHPPGMPIRRYLIMWIYSALAAVACWGLFLLFAGETASTTATTGGWTLQGALNLLVLTWASTCLCVLLFMGTVGAIVSHGKGRPHKEGFFFGLFLGPLGWILAGLMPNHASTT